MDVGRGKLVRGFSLHFDREKKNRPTNRADLPAAGSRFLCSGRRGAFLRRMPKKRCELGKACPYQHEHQHVQEYHHSDTPANTRNSSRPKGGSVLGGRAQVGAQKMPSGGGLGAGSPDRGGNPRRRGQLKGFVGVGHKLGGVASEAKRLTQKRRAEDKAQAVTAALARFDGGQRHSPEVSPGRAATKQVKSSPRRDACVVESSQGGPAGDVRGMTGRAEGVASGSGGRREQYGARQGAGAGAGSAELAELIVIDD